MHLQKFPDQTKFQSWVVNFQAEVCAKAKNLALVLQWIKKIEAASLLRTSSIQNQYREDFFNYESCIWWRRQNWNGATIGIRTSKRGSESKSGKPKRTTDFSREPECFFDERNYRAWSRSERKGAKILTPSGRLENVFQRKTIGYCSKKTLVVFNTRMPRKTVRQCGKTWETQENLAQSKHPLQYRNWRNRPDVNGFYSLKASPATKAEHPLSTAGKMKKIVVWLSTSSRVSWLQV